MAYLAKLAKRISNARSFAASALWALGACAQGESKDFLNPDPKLIVPVPVALRIDPELSIVPANQPTRFTATGLSANGQTLSVTVVWSAGGGLISSDGVFTADHSGQYVVRAQLTSNPSLQDSARAAVWEQPSDVLEVIVSPDSTVVEPDESIQLDALAKLANGTVSQTDGLTWQASGGQVDGNGAFSASVVGDYVVSASAQNGAKGDSRVLVRPRSRSVVGFSVTPGAVTVGSGQTNQFTAYAAWSDGSSSVSENTIWSSTGGTISNSGLFTAGSAEGVFRVIGQERNGGHADTALVTVQAPLVAALRADPEAVHLAPGASQHFESTATLADGSTRSVGVLWTASGGSINLNGDYVAGSEPGTYHVIAAVPGTAMVDTAWVTVGSPTATLTAITLNPATASLAAGGARQFSLTAEWSDGSTTSPVVSWTATGGSVSPTGLYAAGSAPGTYRVIARAANGVADTSLILITPPVLTGLSLAPANATVLAGSTQQFTSTGTWSDGSSALPVVAWSAEGGAISASGLYTAAGSAGTYRVIATAVGGTIADTGFVTVSVPTATLTSLLLSPASASLLPGATRQFSVTGTMSDGSSVVPPVSWSATGGTISASGLFAAGQTVGTYRVIARASSGTRADTSTITVTVASPVLTALVISPASASVQTAGTKQFSVSGSWSDGSSVAPAVNWSATGGTITNGGLYSAGATPGAYKVIAVQAGGSKSDTADVTVTAALPPVTLTGLVLTPGSMTMLPGGAQLFAATGLYSDGTAAPLAVNWTATGGTVSSTGLYTAGASTGTFRVVATDPGSGKADTSSVTISAAPPAGQYQTVVSRNWNTYSDKAALAGLFGVEGQNNLRTNPVTVATDYYDLVPDPLFGKVVRYKGGPWANTVNSSLVFGAVATHSVGFTPLTKVWIRQFVRFGPNWWPVGNLPASANNSYKLIFLNWRGAGFRQMFGFLNNNSLGFEYGQGPGSPYPATETYSASRPPDTCLPGQYYAPPMIRTKWGPCNVGAIPDTPGDGEWYEFVMGHEQQSPMTARGTHAWRRYTLNGVVNPGPWTWRQMTRTHSAGQPAWVPADEYQMGVNRNKTFEQEMFWDWGPYQIVDGSIYWNPFGVSGISP